MFKRLFTALAVATTIAGCGSKHGADARLVHDSAHQPSLEIVAESDRQWTGVGITPGGRVFVNYPRWSDNVPVSVAEIVDGQAVAFPGPEWHSWKPGDDPASTFVCVQSVVGDPFTETLWVLDPASPGFAGVVPGGAKLLQFDVATGKVLARYDFDATVAPTASYLNDVRFDPNHPYAYITDSGLGALVVLNLETGKARRVLDNAPELDSEQDYQLIIDGARVLFPDGRVPVVHSDGIAVDSKGEWVYVTPLTGNLLSRIPTAALRDESLGEAALAKKVEKLQNLSATDGMSWGPDGRLYRAALEDNSVYALDVKGGVNSTYVTDPRLSWPDSLAWHPDGSLYVTSAQIHKWGQIDQPYRLFRVVRE